MRQYPLPVEPPYRVRFISPNRVEALLQLYQTAKVLKQNKHARMLQAVDWFCAGHPEYKLTAVYKDLDGLLRGV